MPKTSTHALLQELIDLARQVGLTVRIERGAFRGGYCVKQGDELVVLNRAHPPEVHIALLAEALRNRSLEAIYVKPIVRRALEEAWTRGPVTPAEVLHVDPD
jgi:hypothetical protein